MLCQITETFYVEGVDDGYFNGEYNIDSMYLTYDHNYVNMRVCLIATYFSFTSLSTVGFGDYHPISNYERLFTAMIILIGVAVFSYILGNFIEILHKV